MISKKNRLSKKKVQSVIKSSYSRPHSIFVLKTKKNILPNSCFSVIVPLRVSKKAAERNRAKRIIYEIIQKNLFLIKPGFDCVLILKNILNDFNFLVLEKIILELFKKAKLINE